MKIIIDSSIGFSKEEALQKGYYFIPLQIALGEKNYTEGVDLSASEFYALLNRGLMPHTAQPSPQLYIDVFNDATKDGEDALLLSLSSKVSGAWNAANLAKNECLHPEKVHLFDTLSFFGGTRILLKEAEEHQDLPLDQLLAYLGDLRDRIKVFAGMDTLEYVYKGGRLS